MSDALIAIDTLHKSWKASLGNNPELIRALNTFFDGPGFYVKFGCGNGDTESKKVDHEEQGSLVQPRLPREQSQDLVELKGLSVESGPQEQQVQTSPSQDSNKGQTGFYQGKDVKSNQQAILVDVSKAEELHAALVRHLEACYSAESIKSHPERADAVISKVKVPGDANQWRNTYTAVKPIAFPNEGAYQARKNNIQRSNKKVLKQAEQLLAAQRLWRQAQRWMLPYKRMNHPSADDATAEKPAVLISVDFEWWEKDSTELLEIGWSVWDNVSSMCSSRHWIVSEGLRYSNGRYVPNHRHAFRFGVSETGPLEDGLAALQADMDAALHNPVAHFLHPGAQYSLPAAVQLHQPDGTLCDVALVGHGMTQDLQMLRDWGITVHRGVTPLDTAKVWWAMHGGDMRMISVSLRTLLNCLKVPDVNKLHNGGNDARYTLEALLRLPGLNSLPALHAEGDGMLQEAKP